MEQTITQSLKGKKLPQLDFDWEIAGSLIWYEMPLHTHVIDEHNQDYFHCFVDTDEERSRWILFKTPAESLWRFFNKKMTNQELMMQNPDGFVYFIDVPKKDKNAKPDFYKIKNADIPAIYHFPEKSYFEESTYEKYALELKTYLSLHFNRKQVLYQIKNPNLSMVAEPKTDYQKKKKP